MNQMSEPAVPLVLSRITIATTYHSREEPTSKDQKATSLWALGCHKPVIPVVTFLTPLARNLLINSKGSIGHAFAVCIRTGNQDQASFCPFTLREVSVLSELALGHLRYILTDVPPQSNSPPDTVFGAKHWAEIRDSQRPQGPSVSSVLIRQSDSPSPPTGPVLRANPYPEVTDLICRLPLPTLFYRLEAVHLGDLLRIWEPWRFTETTSLSPAEPIPGSPFLNQKRELWLGLYSMFPSSFAISLEYLLLPPRSAPMEAQTGPTPKVFNANHCDPLTRCGQVSCYTFLSGFQLPWPPSCCLYQPTPFMGSHERKVWHFNSTFGSSHSASSAYQKWPTWSTHSMSMLHSFI
ncbi:hypothetical protein ACO02O_05762 [Dirofilaria immitis]